MTTLSPNPTLAEVLALPDRDLTNWRERIRRERDRAQTTVDALRLNNFLTAIEEEATKRGLCLPADSRFALPLSLSSEHPWDLEPVEVDCPASWPEDDGLDWQRAAEPSRRDLPDVTKEPCAFCMRVNDGCRLEDGRFVCGEDRRREAGR